MHDMNHVLHPKRFCGDTAKHAPHTYNYGEWSYDCNGPVADRFDTPREDKAMEYEEVDHPAHYGGDTPYEVIKVLEAWDEELGMPLNLTSAIKYLARAGRKPGAAFEKDLRKAIWHIEREIKRRSG